ncbi:protein suppressor of hairy wing-like [Mizuhopecten yessoensis]|uniref:protein suppressor of hairy wing-like n=1 Tax=Mizuhopecten yessoensis TaxID=6573 RepID=UPI000B459360|nr:protein suppressor of hairy wing-like [Mizuhopecten yessoensis]
MTSFDSFPGGIEPPESDNPLQCRYCGKIFTRSNYRREHERIHTGEKPYECGFCARRFNSKGSCNKHEQSHMNREKKLAALTWRPFTCHICQQTFKHESVLKKHILFHTGLKKYQCEICLKFYFTSYDLRVHVRFHTGEKPYKCRMCNVFFTTGRKRNLHEKFHVRQDTLQCKKCKTIFRSVNALKLHKYKSQLRRTGCAEPDDSYAVNNSAVIDDGSDGSVHTTLELEEGDSRMVQATGIESQDTSGNDDSSCLVVNENIDDQDDNSVELDIEVLGNHYRNETAANETLLSNGLPSMKTSPSKNIQKRSQTRVVFPTGLFRSTDQGIEVSQPLSQSNRTTKQSIPKGIDSIDSSRGLSISRYHDTRFISDDSTGGSYVEERSYEYDAEEVMSKSVDSCEPGNIETGTCRLGATGFGLSTSPNDGPNNVIAVKTEVTDEPQTTQVFTSALGVLNMGSTEEITSLAKQRILNDRSSDSSSLRISNAAISPLPLPRITNVAAFRKEPSSSPSSSTIGNVVPVYNSITPQLVKTSVIFDRTLDEPRLTRPDTPSTSELTVVSTSVKHTQTKMIDDADLLFAEMESARKVFECKHCSIIFRDFTMYLVHKTLHVDTSRPFVCHLCGNEARDKVDFHSHHIWHMK